MHFTPSTIPALAAAALAPAFARSMTDDAETWLDRCLADQAQLWRDGDLWCITEVRETKAGRVLHGVALAGDYNDRLIPEIEAWARSIGCVSAVLSGRRGFAKRLPDYRIQTITLSKEL